MLPCRPSESSASAVPSFPPPRAFPTFSGQRASDQPHPRPSSPLLHPRQHQWGAGAVGTVPLPPRGAGGAPTERTRPRVLTGIRRPRAEGSTPKAPSPCTGLAQHPGRREGRGPWEPKITKSLSGRTAAGSPTPRTRPDSAHTPPGVNLGAFCKHFPGCGATRQWGVTPGICTEPGAVLVCFFFYFPP